LRLALLFPSFLSRSQLHKKLKQNGEALSPTAKISSKLPLISFYSLYPALFNTFMCSTHNSLTVHALKPKYFYTSTTLEWFVGYIFRRIRFLVISPNERKNRIRTEREKDVPMQEKVAFSSLNTKKSFASLAKKMDNKNKYRTNFSLLARVKKQRRTTTLVAARTTCQLMRESLSLVWRGVLL
jgi:hypothetical protein